jgi:hypothetical protein
MSEPPLEMTGQGHHGIKSQPPIEFFSIELSPMSAGQFHVGVYATVCEEEGDLTRMDLGSRRVASLDEAFGVIRAALSGN